MHKAKKPVKKVALEGRTRLPQRVQDLVIELGSAMTSIQQMSGSNETLVTSIRNFAAVDGIMYNSAQNLDKLSKQLDKMEGQTNEVDAKLNKVNVVADQFAELEQSDYCTSAASPRLKPKQNTLTKR